MSKPDSHARQGLILLHLIRAAAEFARPCVTQVFLRRELMSAHRVQNCSAATISNDVKALEAEGWLKVIRETERRPIVRLSRRRPVLMHWKAAKTLELAVRAAEDEDDDNRFEVDSWVGRVAAASSMIPFTDHSVRARCVEFIQQFRRCGLVEEQPEPFARLVPAEIERHQFYLGPLGRAKSRKLYIGGPHARFMAWIEAPPTDGLGCQASGDRDLL